MLFADFLLFLNNVLFLEMSIRIHLYLHHDKIVSLSLLLLLCSLMMFLQLQEGLATMDIDLRADKFILQYLILKILKKII